MRRKGFEPSHPLRDKALNLKLHALTPHEVAHLTRLCHLRKIIISAFSLVSLLGLFYNICKLIKLIIKYINGSGKYLLAAQLAKRFYVKHKVCVACSEFHVFIYF